MVHHLHNTVINIEQINDNIKDKLCNRRDLLSADEINLVYDKLKNTEDIVFMGNDITEGYPSMNYKLIIYGILPCGSKAVVEIEGINPYIDVQGSNKLNAHQNITKIRNFLIKEGIEYSNLQINRGKPFILYNENEYDFIRIYFKNLKNRKEAIKSFQSKNITTYNNDISCYYRVVARDFKLNLASWNKISNYKVIYNSYIYKCEYHIKVDITNINQFDENIMDIPNIPQKMLQLDRSISMCFDIEAYAGNKNGDIPNGKNPEDILFMLCMTYQFINSDKYLLNVCLVTKPCEAQPDLFTIVCHTESNLIKLFALLNENIQPDFITEFNGSDFDWPFIIDKAQMFNDLTYLVEHMSIKKLNQYDLNIEKILKWQYKEERVKVEADRSVISRNLKLQGYLPFDTRIMFKQLYPIEAKSSLNHYLMLNNLGSKDDMPINELFRIFREGTAAEMKLVAHYCFIDSWKLHLLNKKKNVIQDRREVCKLSYTSIFDGFYRAGGLKVRNLIIANALSRNLYVNNYRPRVEPTDEDEEKGKYPGAMVLNPKKGLVSPVYTIYEYNDKLDDNKVNDNELQEIQNYINNNFELVYLKNEINYEILSDNSKKFMKVYIEYLSQNKFKYPISGLDFSSLYPSLIMAYNLSPEFLITDKSYAEELKNKGIDTYEIKFPFMGKPVNGWTVRHNESNEITNFGLYPSILKFLFNERKQMKKKLSKYKEMKEHFETLDNYLDNSEYHDCLFNLSYVDSKQKALKVFMNTFYGELGNQRSPLFTLPLAGGITSAGKTNLQMIYDYVSNQKCKVYYGDSVTGDTPIIIRENNITKLLTISELGWDKYTIDTYNSKEIIQSNNFDNDIIEVLTENGWTRIKKMIRHYTDKQLYKVITNSGLVIVTEDHSLLNTNKEKIEPHMCNIGTELLHWDNDSLNTEDLESLNMRSIRYTEIHDNSYYHVSCSSQLIAQQYYLNTLLYPNLDCHIENDGITYSVIFTKKDTSKNKNKIISIEKVRKTSGYVYDLETETHHFAAGIGKLVVHNTDSLYISCPDKHFLDINKQYYTQEIDKENYCKKLVEKTFKIIDIIKNEVNNLLISDNGTPYLKMAYEEVLYPAVFLAKKKYYGIPHEGLVNFNPKDLFIRGLEVTKRGVSDLLKKVCLDIMWESCSLHNTKTIRELVEKKIHTVFNTKWDINDFAQSVVWKPEKQNITLNMFIDRMREGGFRIPEPYERFKVVVIRKYPYKYDLKGRQIVLKKGDKIEYLELAIEKNLEIDLNYYFEGELTGQFSRLICYDTEFEEYLDNGDIDDDKTFKNCQKYILELSNKYSNKFVNRGKIFKDIYKNVNKKIKVKKIYDDKTTFIIQLGKNISGGNFERDLIMNIISYAENMYNYSNTSNNIIDKYRKNNESKKYLNELHNLYCENKKSYYHNLIKCLTSDINDTRNELIKLLLKDNTHKTLFNIDDINIENVINHIRNKYNLDNMCKQNDLSITCLDDICHPDDIDNILDNTNLYKSIETDNIYKIYNLIIKLISLYSKKILNETIFNSIHSKLTKSIEPINETHKNNFIYNTF